MEQFLIAALGSVAALLALILGSQYRTRPAAAGRPRRAIGASVAIVALAGILVVVCIVYAGLAAVQQRDFDEQKAALEAQNGDLQAQLKALSAHQHRAWVYATPALNGPMIIKGGGVSLAAHYQLENRGDAPAAGVQIASAVIPHVEVDIQALQQSLCEHLHGNGATPMHDSLVPGQGVELARIERADAEFAEGQAVQGGSGVKFWWVGCVGYQTAGDPMPHRSRFMYEVAETGAGPDGIVAISLADQIIPKSRLVMIPHRGGGFAAD
jgi:hypothetical protein